jgi:hypothetical protein
MMCSYCKRDLPSKDWKTSKGCRWCDFLFWKKENALCWWNNAFIGTEADGDAFKKLEERKYK